MFTKEEFNEMVSAADKIVITSHIGPDPDAFASALSVRWYLDKYFPEKSFKIHLEASPNVGMTYIPHHEQINFADDITEILNDADLCILVDGCELKRFTHYPEKLKLSDSKTICIDHHATPPDKFDLLHVDTTAAAAAQLIEEILLDESDLKYPDLARILLYGIMADSGTFKYVTPKTARVFSVAQRIVETSGVDLQELDLHLSSYTLEEMDIIRVLIENTQNTTIKNAKEGLTFTYLPKSIYEKGYTKELITRAKNNYQFSYLRRVDNNPWGFVVTPREDLKTFKVSMRSIPGAPNVRHIAEALNGGGHDMAASGTIEAEEIDSDEVCKMVLEKMESIELEPVVVKGD